MCVNDVLVQGAEPLFFLDYFATGKLDVDTTVAVVGGIAKGCELAGCALIGGETAEMPDMYPPGEYDLAGFTVGAVEKSELHRRHARCAHGDVLIGIASSGPAFQRLFAGAQDLRPRRARPTRPATSAACRLVDALMAPTRIYVKPMLELLAQARPPRHGAHHRRRPEREHHPRHSRRPGPAISTPAASWPAAGVRLAAARRRRCRSAEMWRTFNCGIGFVLVVKPAQAGAVSQSLDALGLKHKPIGQVITQRGDERTLIA